VNFKWGTSSGISSSTTGGADGGGEVDGTTGGEVDGTTVGGPLAKSSKTHLTKFTLIGFIPKNR